MTTDSRQGWPNAPQVASPDGFILKPHRKHNPRKCDRCSKSAVWIVHRRGRRDEYSCADHVPEQ